MLLPVDGPEEEPWSSIGLLLVVEVEETQLTLLLLTCILLLVELDEYRDDDKEEDGGLSNPSSSGVPCSRAASGRCDNKVTA
jgi:hypothetical protein